MNSATLVQKLWNYCNVLRDDGMSYGDYPRLRGDRLPQLTYLLFISGHCASRPLREHEPPLKRARARFLKIADERSRPPYHQPSRIPAPYAWPSPLARDGDTLFDRYRHTLEELGEQPGTLALTAASAMEPWPGAWRHRHPALDILEG